MNVDWSELLQQVLAILLPTIVALVALFAGYAKSGLQNYFEMRAHDEKQSARDKAAATALKFLSEVVNATVGAAQQTVMQRHHQMAADGKISKEELAEIGAAVKQSVMDEVLAQTLGRVQAALGLDTASATKFIGNKVEAAVLMTKAATAPLAPAPVLSPGQNPQMSQDATSSPSASE